MDNGKDNSPVKTDEVVVLTHGAKVKRGQKIAVVRTGSPSFLHFEVREGLNSTDPVPFLNP